MVLRKFVYLSLILVSCSESPTRTDEKVPVGFGQDLYASNCAACHGSDGKLGAGGASDLSTSDLSTETVADVIEKGRKSMPPHSHVYETKEELDSLVAFVLTLR